MSIGTIYDAAVSRFGNWQRCHGPWSFLTLPTKDRRISDGADWEKSKQKNLGQADGQAYRTLDLRSSSEALQRRSRWGILRTMENSLSSAWFTNPGHYLFLVYSAATAGGFYCSLCPSSIKAFFPLVFHLTVQLKQAE